jgi:hypothetical protein
MVGKGLERGCEILGLMAGRRVVEVIKSGGVDVVVSEPAWMWSFGNHAQRAFGRLQAAFVAGNNFPVLRLFEWDCVQGR